VNAPLAQRSGALHRIAFREHREKGLRVGEFGELLGRREALDRLRQHGVRIGVAIGRATKLRKRQRGAQFETARLLRLRDSDRGLQRLLSRRGVGRVALQQDLAADAVDFRFVPTGLSGLQVDERIVQAPEPGISLAGTRFGFGQGRFEAGQEPIPTLLPTDGKAASHLGDPRLFGIVGPLCPALKKNAEAGDTGWEIVSRHDIGQRFAVGRDCFVAIPNDPLSQKRAQRASERLAEARTRTFRDVAEEYIARNEAGWRNAKHRGQWRRTLEMFAYDALAFGVGAPHAKKQPIAVIQDRRTPRLSDP